MAASGQETDSGWQVANSSSKGICLVTRESKNIFDVFENGFAIAPPSSGSLLDHKRAPNGHGRKLATFSREQEKDKNLELHV
jgi:hypothetical protein